jgi:hypothetical protein
MTQSEVFGFLFWVMLGMAAISALPRPEVAATRSLLYNFYAWLWQFLQTACINLQHLNPQLGALAQRTETNTNDGHGATSKAVVETVSVALPNEPSPNGQKDKL